jgi:hypothetical protein
LSEYAGSAVLFNSSSVMRKYCTPITNEVAQIFLTANKEK